MATVAPAALCAWVMLIGTAAAAPPTIAKTTASKVTSTTATLEADVNPGGKLTRYHFEYGTADCAFSPCASIPIPEGEIPAGSSPVRVTATVEGLAPGTVYHFRATAKNGEGGTIKGADRIFATLSGSFEGLPDARVYEQASPVDKDGGDAVGIPALVKAAIDGSGITFASTFGIPGGKGAQALPSYLALRGPGQSGWATQGLLPPAVFGERAQVQGWLPDFSETFSNVTKLGNPRVKALVSQSTSGGPVIVISPYTANAEYSYVGADADASTIFFESQAKLPPAEGEVPLEAAIEGKPNIYAWDRASSRLSLAGVLNDGAVPPNGALAGPYHWSAGTSPQTLRLGGPQMGYYLQGTHAITASGDIYFTEAGTGQLYLRLNPTRPQSEVTAGKCTKPADACTIRVSASKRTAPDPAGAQPAAFQAASADGSMVFFTSSEKLTNNANTGPEQPPPAIGAGNVATGEIEDADFIPKRAVGVAVDAEHVYWADPIGGTIGRAEIDGKNPDEGFIVPGPSECEETEPGVFEQVSSIPRYIAVDKDHVYWTNTGKLDENGDPVEDGGTVGRADIDGAPASVDPDFICGASNPQGIAVNATHVYWASAGKDLEDRSIGRAEIDGEGVEQVFFKPGLNIPHGVALSGSHLYFDQKTDDSASIRRIPLEGGEEEFLFIGQGSEIRSVAIDAANVYWTAQGEGSIGRIPLSDFAETSICKTTASCKKDFVKGIEGALNGLAVDSSRLYWSVNGETLPNPGNDLYRYRPAEDELVDLTPDPVGNGTEVQGVLGASEDGSHLYFAANGDLDGAEGATQGNCQTTPAHGSLATTSGSCSIYLWNEGQITFVARVTGGGGMATDAVNWVGTPRELFGSASYDPKPAFVSDDGQTLLFRSQENLTEYDSEGVPELYRWSAVDQTLRCASCSPGGEAAGEGPTLGSTGFPGSVSPPIASVSMLQSRNLSADGNRVFFDTTEALLPPDTNGESSCEFLACRDVYEWEAPGAGTCKETAPAYSPLNAGCLYLISTGKSPSSSAFGDASADGDGVFFFTRQQLVGQDGDELQDVYDARLGGGLVMQNPVVVPPCESAEACHGPAPPPPAEQSPGSAGFVGPGDPVGKHKKQKTKKRAKGKKHANGKKQKTKKKRRARTNLNRAWPDGGAVP